MMMQTINKKYFEEQLGKISNRVYYAALSSVGRDSQQCLMHGREMNNESHLELMATNIDYYRRFYNER